MRLGGGTGRQQEWVLARELLTFVSIDARSIPQRQRLGYAKVAISRWNPFEDGGHHLEWSHGWAMVWAWSRSALLVDEDGAAGGSNPRRVWPEPLLRGSPQAGGEELVRMNSGLEGRVWRDFGLAAAEWWPDAPSLNEWNQFRRGAGLAPVTTMPDIVDPPLAASPWTKGRSAVGVGDWAAQFRPLVAGLILAVAVALIIAPAVSALKLWGERLAVESDIEAAGQRVAKILDAKDATLGNADRIQKLIALRPAAGQVELMAATTKLLPGNDWEILAWRMPDDRSLDIEVRRSNPDPAGLARTWEASELFEGVTVELGQAPDTIRIRATIVRRMPGSSK